AWHAAFGGRGRALRSGRRPAAAAQSLGGSGLAAAARRAHRRPEAASAADGPKARPRRTGLKGEDAMDIRLNGKTALITGSSLGLGRAMALAFAKAGGDVAITARRADVLEQTKAEIVAQKGGKVVAIAADVSKAADCERLFKEASRELGRVDILVNNAG